MKKSLLSLVLYFSIFALSAQDVIYTVSGELNEEKLFLDSILVDNLTNNTWITFNNLPDELYYQINLTKKAYWGTTGINHLQNNMPGFIESQNMPGEITLTYNNSISTEARISVFNINGQKIYSSAKQKLFPGNSVQVKLAETGVYLIQVVSDFGAQSFKGIGANNVTGYAMEIADQINSRTITKSGAYIYDTDFSFILGDSIRFSVYKEGYFALPISKKIVNAGSVNFLFEIARTEPTVTTLAATDIATTTAKLNGNVTADGNATITQRGFYWSATDNMPDSTDNIITVTGTTGSYNKTISSLTENSTYYYRAFATNSQGTATGSVQSFKTTIAISAPTVTTLAATDIATTTAKLKGEVTADGNATITQRGFYWSKTDNTPDDGDDIIIVTGTTGSYNKTISSLTENTTYYYRAFATNSQGTATGSVQSFKTTIAISAPTVTTLAATDIATTTAKLKGEVTADGNATITQRGFYWSKTDNTPDDGDNKEIVTGTTGTYNKTISSLTENTTYYYRAFATNSQGTATGSVQSFKTTIAISVPTVTTLAATDIATTTAKLKGEVTADGNATITQRGFYWSKTDNTPDVGDNKEIVTGTTGTYNKTISSLTENTTYYYRAFATNSQGTATGSVQSFKTEEEQGGGTSTFTDSRDGKTYKTVTIGNQEWMAENLAYLPSSPSSAESNTEPYYYVYGYQGTSVSEAKATDNYSTYGVLYNWPAAKAACPSGWHLPTDAEWKEMEMAIGMSQSEADGTSYRGTNEGTKLKATNGWFGNGNGTDDYGFSGLPGGDRSSSGTFADITINGAWWSATENSASRAWRLLLRYDAPGIHRFYYKKESGFSVRCVRD